MFYSEDSIDRLCDEYEALWLDDNELTVEQFMKNRSLSPKSDLIDELILLEVDLRFAAGLPVDKRDYDQRFPNHPTAIQNAFQRISSSNCFLGEVRTVTEGPGAPQIDSSEIADIPSRLGQFEKLDKLGQGSFGVVFRGRNLETNQLVALKFPRKKSIDTLHEINQFRLEAELARKLEHPAIVKSYGLYDAEGFIFIAQQLVTGSSLRQVRSSFTEVEKIVKLIVTLANAIGYAHRQGIIHRDLKPANVMIDENGNPLIADFGLCIHESFQRRLKGQRSGTAAYMSPEQVLGLTHHLDGRSDIWSLGVMLYELLTRRRPFNGPTDDDIFEEIKSRNEKPIQLHRPDLDDELQRICMKCLSKQIRDRYTTAEALADDLMNWLEFKDQWAAKKYVPLIPRGLAPFGADDKDAFVELLPGPVNRNGIPESIQFWKSRIESMDPTEQFFVGVIFGPSGSGKSSFVRAGLLPNLPPKSVTPIYVEATAKDTEVRIFKALRARWEIPSDASLPETLDGLRNGNWADENTRILIVIDQFEQWLDGNLAAKNSQLAQALQHCDGSKICCILSVRDEYWLNTSRLLEELGIDLRERDNALRIDRFDFDHAQHVLYRLGRALKKLPGSREELSRQENEFLRQVVTDLADDDNVISVHLTLFAEMFKNRTWTSRELSQVGGVAAVGTKYLEETFESNRSTPQLRSVNRDAQLILETLLPKVGGILKGMMQPVEKLKESLGPKCDDSRFQKCLKVLRDDLRLIVRVDPDYSDNKGPDADSTSQTGEYYQLTHDYLVPSIRDWLVRKKKSTWQGKAELNLQDLAGQWNIGHEQRFLPTVGDFAKIKLGVPIQKQTKAQKEFLKTAGWLHLKRIGILAVLLLLIGFTGYRLFSRATDNHVNTLVQNYLLEPPQVASSNLDLLRQYPNRSVELLREHVSDTDPIFRLRAEIGLSTLEQSDEASAKALVKDIAAIQSNEELRYLLNELEPNTRFRDLVIKHINEAAKSSLPVEAQVRYAVFAACLGDPFAAEEMIRKTASSPQKRAAGVIEYPTATTSFVQEMEDLFGTFEQQEAVRVANHLIELCNDRKVSDNFLFYTLTLMSQIDPSLLIEGCRDSWAQLTREQYKNHVDSGVHSICGFLAIKWQFELEELGVTQTPPKDKNWWVVDVAGTPMTFVRVKPGSFIRAENTTKRSEQQKDIHKPGLTSIVSEYWIASSELSFTTLEKWNTEQKRFQFYRTIAGESRTTNKSAFGLDLDQSIEFVQWLNQYSDHIWAFSIPTVDQWEFACRGGSRTLNPWGNKAVTEYLKKYAVIAESLDQEFEDCLQSAANRIPNRIGLFDMIGNVQEFAKMTTDEQTSTGRRVAFLMGGSTDADAYLCAGYFIGVTPKNPFVNAGIRLILEIESN